MFVAGVCMFVARVGVCMCVFGRVLVVGNAGMINLLLYEIGNEELNVRCGLFNARQAILHEVDYPWVARAIRGWPGSATGPEHSSLRGQGLVRNGERREELEAENNGVRIPAAVRWLGLTADVKARYSEGEIEASSAASKSWER